MFNLLTDFITLQPRTEHTHTISVYHEFTYNKVHNIIMYNIMSLITNHNIQKVGI